jgi:hypothetical protein
MRVFWQECVNLGEWPFPRIEKPLKRKIKNAFNTQFNLNLIAFGNYSSFSPVQGASTEKEFAS